MLEDESLILPLKIGNKANIYSLFALLGNIVL